MCNKFSYTPSAIEYSINPIGTGGNDENRRLDCVIGIKVFNKTKKHNLYINEECNEVISYIFDKESLNYEIFNDSFSNDTNISDISYVIDSDTSNCFIKLDICGKNIEKEISDILDKEEIQDLDVVTINLNMNHINSKDGMMF